MFRNSIFLFFVLVFNSSTYGQKNVIYDSKRYCISISLNNFKIWEPSNTVSFGAPFIEAEDLSAGKVYANDSMFICYDTIRLAKYKYEFKIIDKYRMQVTNKTPFFWPDEILYVSVVTDSIGRPVQYLSWKDGKPHGNWEYIYTRGTKFVLYENGVIVKEYFKTNEEILEDLKKSRDTYL